MGTSKHLDSLFSSFAEDTREWKTAEEKAKELYLEDEGRQQAFLNGVQYANQLTAENSKNDVSSSKKIFLKHEESGSNPTLSRRYV